jgi:protein-S-isoprenylcysteine O-methyltransferase Ste14
MAHALCRDVPAPTDARERRLVALSRYRIQLGFCFVIPALLLAQPTTRSYLVFLPVVLAGLALRTWARGHLDRAERVCTGGPYGWVRHPLYVGSFLMGLGVTLMALPWPMVPLFAIVFVAMYLPKALREETYLSRRFGDRYAAYATLVPAVMPHLLPRNTEVDPSVVQWRRVWRHREWHTWIGLAAVLASVWVPRVLWP